MKTTIPSVAAALGLGAALAVMAAPAAACMSGPALARLKAAGVQTTPAQQRVATAFEAELSTPTGVGGSGPMPGLWKFQFINADGTNGDMGFDAFAVGGTEVINSFHAPEIGNVCLGVWKQLGPHHVKINHYAPLFDTDLVTFIGTLNIQEDLTLAADGKTFAGSSLFTGYDTVGNMTFQSTGTVAGTRYTLQSPGY